MLQFPPGVNDLSADMAASELIKYLKVCHYNIANLYEVRCFQQFHPANLNEKLVSFCSAYKFFSYHCFCVCLNCV